jgi:hypothetical protein
VDTARVYVAFAPQRWLVCREELNIKEHMILSLRVGFFLDALIAVEINQ